MHNFRFLYLILSLFFATEWLPSARASDEAEVAHVPPVTRVCACGDHDCALARTDIPRGKGSSGRWKDTTTPKRGWVCTDLEDKGEAHIVCQMCKREEIRYAHLMSHAGFPEKLAVGCICAAYMEGSLDPDAEDAPAKIRVRWAQNRTKWLLKIANPSEWQISRNGADYFLLRCRALTSYDIYVRKGTYGRYRAFALNKDEGRKDKGRFEAIPGWHASRDEAARAAFDVLFPRMPVQAYPIPL